MDRMEFGFARTACACRACTISCEHVPGVLAPPDIPRMAEFLGFTDIHQFARDNLLASEGVPVMTAQGKVLPLPTLVPATQPNGHCKFLANGRCTIHAASPYGCAFIDAHQPGDEYRRRADALYRALHDHWTSHGQYAQIWNELHQAGRDAPPLEKRQFNLTKALRREKLL